MTPDGVVDEELAWFEVPDLAGEKWTPDRLRGSKTVLFCFASW